MEKTAQELIELLAHIRVELDLRKPNVELVKKMLDDALVMAANIDGRHSCLKESFGRLSKIWGQ